MKKKKIIILTGPGFEDTEVIYPYYRLKEAGYETGVATSSDIPVTGKHGVPFAPTVKLGTLKAQDYDGVVIPGGLEAPDRLRQVPGVVNFVREMYKTGKLVSSICHGPWVLCSAGILKGRKATCYAGMKDDLINAGAKYTGEAVTVDGNLITSDHPRSLHLWMEATVKYLTQR